MHETSHTDLGSAKFLETEMKKLVENRVATMAGKAGKAGKSLSQRSLAIKSGFFLTQISLNIPFIAHMGNNFCFYLPLICFHDYYKDF